MNQPSYLVYGYHGTSETLAQQILRQGYQYSENDYDWLGRGVYFFQDAPSSAWEWASERYPREPAVLRSIITLADCLDLVDTSAVEVVKLGFQMFYQRCQRLNLTLPRQTKMAHRLDCAVLDQTVKFLAPLGQSIRTVRGIFEEGEPIFPDSALTSKGHIQIAVRDLVLLQETVIIEKTSIA